MNELNVKLIAVLLTTIEYIQSRDRLMTEQEAANVLGIHIRTLKQYRYDGHIHYISLGGSIRYRREHLEEFINRNDTLVQKLQRKEERRERQLRDQLMAKHQVEAKV